MKNISDKRAAKLAEQGIRLYGSSIAPSSKPKESKPRAAIERSAPPPRKSGVKKVNVKRAAANFIRTLHSKARQRFVQSLPCIACGVVGYSVNAHTENDGKSRKGPYTSIVPLCEFRPNPAFHSGMPDSAAFLRGHHRELDAGDGREAFEQKYKLSLAAKAAETEAAWLESPENLSRDHS